MLLGMPGHSRPDKYVETSRKRLTWTAELLRLQPWSFLLFHQSTRLISLTYSGIDHSNLNSPALCDLQCPQTKTPIANEAYNNSWLPSPAVFVWSFLILAWLSSTYSSASMFAVSHAILQGKFLHVLCSPIWEKPSLVAHFGSLTLWNHWTQFVVRSFWYSSIIPIWSFLARLVRMNCAMSMQYNEVSLQVERGKCCNISIDFDPKACFFVGRTGTISSVEFSLPFVVIMEST